MSRFSVEIIPEAETDIREAYLWCRARSPLAADAFRTELLGKIDALQDNADTWTKDEDGFHCQIPNVQPSSLTQRPVAPMPLAPAY